MPTFDAVVVGAGPAGEEAVSRLTDQGLTVAIVERELIGGECAYWACIPSKTLLRTVEVRAEAERVKGVTTPAIEWADAAAYRDWMVRDLIDTAQVEDYERQGVAVYKGAARLRGRGQVDVGDTLLQTERVIIATGSVTRVPPIAGLEQAGYWTNREATTLSAIPESLAIIGGGPVGIELSQMLRRFGAEVHLIEAGERLIAREDPRVSELMAEALAADGVELHLSTEIESVTAGKTIHTAGKKIKAQQIVVAAGRSPRVADLGLETVGVHAYRDGIDVDDRCRAAPGVWAVGDVTGTMPFTHVAKYQARIACADIAGEAKAADYSAVPRVVFSDPEIAAVGLTEEQAGHRDIETARIILADSISRPWTYESEPRGELAVIADRERGVLLGAWAVAPLASEWIHYAALAIKTATPIDVLRDTVAQFPTYTEGFLKALAELKL